MSKKDNKPQRERVVMNEQGGHGRVEKVTPDQLKSIESTPAWLRPCRATRTNTEGSQA